MLAIEEGKPGAGLRPLGAGGGRDVPLAGPVSGVVSQVDGSISFNANPLNEGGESINAFQEYQAGDVKVEAEEYRKANPDFQAKLPVRSIPLDRLLPSGRIAVKIDTEGSETDVLQSGQDLFSAGWYPSWLR